jgi:signal transduction histidine kinase
VKTLARDIRQEVRDQQRDFLVERARVALWVLIGGTLVFAFADAVLAPEHLAALWAVKATTIAFFAVALGAFRVGGMRRWSAPLALTSTALGYLVSASAATILGQLEVSMMLCGVIALALASALPWGVGGQLVHIGLGAGVILVCASGIPSGDAVILGYPGVVVAVLFTASLYLAFESRRQTERQAEAYVDRREAEERTATLLEIARDISGTLDRQQILDRVARRAVRSLVCDALMVFYWDGERRIYRVIAQHGLPQEWAAQTEALRISADAPMVRYLQRHQSAVIEGTEAQSLIQPALLQRFNIAAVAAAQLSVRQRGIGALLALRFAGNASFSPAQRELLAGIARHVAIAVEVAELHESVKKEGEVSAALARAGRELIAALDPPELMSRLSRITAESLAADSSCTFLQDPRDQMFAPVAGFGFGDEAWEALRLLRLPAEGLAPLIARLERNEVVQFVPAEHSPQSPFDRLIQQYELKAALYAGVRRGDRLIGFQVAHLHGRPRGFGRQQFDILRGIAGLASLALENAYLMSELARANSIKSDFVATMSHELRTPLNAIIGYNSLMRDGEFGALTAEQVAVCDHIDRSSKTLLDLVSATLDVSRLEAGQVGLNLSEFSPAAMLGGMRQEIGRSSNGQVRIDWDIDRPLPVLHSDQLKLRVILKNLIENALKFTDEGCVRISAHAKDDGIELAVSDTGIGIPHESQAAVFEAFQQLDGSSTRRHGGVGLGLYIVRRLVEMLGGSIGLSSEPGRGSTFCVWVPVRFGEATAKAAAAN